ncbi:hypothetical protein [Epilithonimonas sp. UC225_85]|uniref:hypothetical protein n=1 Tax=Epilithonimonas sp. UC225_85 TaxID=3350167 RepID=UPI0036D2304D
MKKFISTISILAIVIFTNSCRAQDEDLETETFNKKQTDNIFKRDNDSITIDSATAITNQIPADPPPKNGHQW